MSEPIWCDIHFKTPTTWGTEGNPPEFVEFAAEALINGYGPDAEVVFNEYTIWQVNGEGNYGLNDDDVRAVLDWCETKHIPYLATEDPKYEWSGEIRLFDDRDVHSRTGDGNGQINLSHSEWLGLVAKHTGSDANLNVGGLFHDVEAYFTLPELADIPIHHLPAKCPPWDDADEEDK